MEDMEKAAFRVMAMQHDVFVELCLSCAEFSFCGVGVA